jgi:hypothetical protein
MFKELFFPILVLKMVQIFHKKEIEITSKLLKQL